MKLPEITFKADDCYKLATMVSNEYFGTQKTIECQRLLKNDYYHIDSTDCDSSPSIRVYCSLIGKGIERIEVNGDYTDGWQEVTQFTYDKIIKGWDEYFWNQNKIDKSRLEILQR